MSIKTYTCPTCATSIPLDAINVSDDRVLCRSCGETSPLSILAELEDDVVILSGKPPRGIRIKHAMQDACPKLTIVYKHMSIFGLVFSLVFICLMLFGCYVEPLILEGEPWGERQLVCLPILIVLFSIIITLCFSKSTITMCNGKGGIFTGMGRCGDVKRFSYNRQTSLQVGLFGASSDRRPIKELQISTVDQKKVFFLINRMDNANEYAFIAATLRKFFRDDATPSLDLSDSTTRLDEPPHGLRVKHTTRRTDPKLSIIYKRSSVNLVAFLTLFICFLSVPILLIYVQPLALEEQPWGRDQSRGVIVLILTLLLFVIWLFALLGKRTITVCRGKGRIFTGVGLLGFTKHFTYNHQTSLHVGASSTSMNNRPVDELQIITPNQKKATFMIMRPDNADDYAFITAMLSTFFHKTPNT